ncbi:MAG: hypothetical protein RL275_985, partial [Chloroflexota bacterium]
DPVQVKMTNIAQRALFTECDSDSHDYFFDSDAMRFSQRLIMELIRR